MPLPQFPEQLLHYIWQYRLFDHHNLCTSQKQQLKITTTGELNPAAGPDFENAEIKLDGLVWHGAVEIHIRSSDWLRHGHQRDAAYEQVVLHVVYEHDQELEMTDGRLLPTLELKDRIAPELLQRSQSLLASKAQIPCAAQIHSIDKSSMVHWLTQLATERLQQKIAPILLALEHQQNDWSTVFYQQLARSFGLLHNAEAMEQLARRLPLKLLGQYHQLWQQEALAFGQAGLLAGHFQEAYPLKLQKEYGYLQKKHGLKPMPTHSWKWKGMRPSSFPTLRIAMLLRLLQQPYLFRNLVEAQELKDLWPLFKIELDAYWCTHYRLEIVAKRSYKKRLSRHFFEQIAINALIPMLFAYGQKMGQAHFCDKARSWLTQLKAEQHHIAREWEDLGLEANHALESQALLQLKKVYCEQKRCLKCHIGQLLLKQSG